MGLIVSTPFIEVQVAATGAPTISGTFIENNTLTAVTTTISDPNEVGPFSYQWNRNGISISGATSSTYTLGVSDVSTNISVTVSFTDGLGNPESSTSPSYAITQAQYPATGSPTITGTLTEGENISVDTSTISDPNELGPFSYQWKRNGSNITTGGTGITYILVTADVGTTITVQVSFTDGLGNLEVLTSIGYGPIESASVSYVKTISSTNGFGIGLNESSGKFAVCGDTARNIKDGYLAFYNDEGTQLWEKYVYSGGNRERLNAAVVDTNDNTYTCGYKDQGVNSRGMVLKFSSTGTNNWKVEYKGNSTGAVEFHDIVVDSSGTYVHVTGWHINTNGDKDLIIMCLQASNGSSVWVRKIQPAAGTSLYGYGLAISSDGFKLYVVGQQDGGGFYDPFLISISAGQFGGSMLFNKNYGSVANEAHFHDVTVDSNGNIIMVGYVTNFYLWIMKTDSSGTVLWSRYMYKSKHYDPWNGVSVDSADNIYVSGYTTAGYGNNDAMLFKLNPNGDRQYIRALGLSNNAEMFRGIVVHKSSETMLLVGEANNKMLIAALPINGSKTQINGIWKYAGITAGYGTHSSAEKTPVSYSTSSSSNIIVTTGTIVVVDEDRSEITVNF